MQMSSFGSIQMSVIPKEKDPSAMEFVIAAENRKEVIRMDIQKNETIDTFITRMKSMLRGFMNAEPRIPAPVAVKVAEAKAAKSFEETVAEMKKK